MSALDGPVFMKRRANDRYQVRFWSHPADYQEFVRAVEAEGLVIQDVFNDLMIWFTKASLEKRLHIQEVK